MILQVCAAYDSKARAFLAPFTVAHVDMAVRAFAHVANQPGQQVHDHPADFSLHHLGTFDDGTGELVAFEHAVHLGIGSNYIKGVAHVQHEIAQQSVSDEARVQPGSAGGNPA